LTVFTANWTNGTIAAGGSQTVTIQFTPTVAQPYSGTVIVSGDQTNGTNTMAVSGTGTTSCSITVAPLRIPVTSGGGSGQLSITASIPTCGWTATDPDVWVSLRTPPNGMWGPSVAGTGSATVSVGFAVYTPFGPPETSTIRFVCPAGEVDVILCRPDCLAP
jgi:hypothetical protein